MSHHVIWRTQSLAFERIRDDRARSVIFVSHDAPREVLTRKLSASRVERVAVAVVGRHPEHRYTAIVFDPAQLAVRRDIAENQKSPDRIPRRTFQPEATGP
jgi:hypothetical protein